MSDKSVLVAQAVKRTWEQAEKGWCSFLFLRTESAVDQMSQPEFWKDLLPAQALFQGFPMPPTGSAGPLSPFLEYLGGILRQLPPREVEGLLSQARIYSFHRTLFSSWLTTGVPERTDEVLFYPAEQQFEQGRIHQTLGSLLGLLHREVPALYVVEDFQNAGLPLVRCISRWVQDPPQGRITFVFIIRQAGQTQVPARDGAWQSLLSLVESRGFFLRLRDGIPEKHRPSPHKEPTQKERLQWAVQGRAFLALEDTLIQLEILAQKRHRDDPEAVFLRGESLFLMEEFNDAILFLNQALELAQRQGLRGLEARIFCLLSLCHYRKKDGARAWKYWRQGEKIALQSGDPRIIADLGMTQIVLDETLLGVESFRSKAESLMESLESLGFENSLSFIKSLVPYYRDLVDRGGWDNAVVEARNMLDRVKERGNLYRESVLYHTLGYLHEYEGRKSEAFRYFQKAIALRQSLGNPVELIKVYNGTGYFCFTIGDFHTALNFFEKALGYLEPLKDYTETCLTLYNMAMVYFFSGQFQPALEFLENIMEVMDNLGLSELPWHSRIKLDSLAGIAAHHLGYATRSFDFWETAQTGTVDPSARPAHCLLRALIGQETDRPEWVREGLEEALQASLEQNLGYFQTHVLLEKAIITRTVGAAEEFYHCLEEAEGCLQNHPIEAQEILLRHLREKGTWSGFKAPLPELNSVRMLIRGVTGYSRQEAFSHELFQKIHEINFVKNFQTNLAEESEHADILRSSMELIRQNFLVSWLQVLMPEKPPFRTLLSLPGAASQPSPTWHESLDKGVFKPLYFAPGDKRLGAFTSLFAHPLKNSGGEGFWVVLATEGEDNPLSENDAKILGVALTQLDLVLDLHNAKENLKRAATVDFLTGALSRQELVRRIDTEKRRAVRYRKSTQRIFSLFFIDLDNFKYYNDTFGHKIGDVILKHFTTLILSHIRSVDFLGRYGGDEFLAVLPETDLEGSTAVAQRILDSLMDSRGFHEAWRKVLPDDVKIPAEKRLSCSIGITVFDPSAEEDTDSILGRADRALYTSKRRGGGVFSSEI